MPFGTLDALLPHETELVGTWIESSGRVVGDATCERINRLTNGVLEVVQDHPKFGGWRRLFRDRADGRYWERSYPHGDWHGGGPPALRWVSDDDVAKEYDLRL